MNNSIIDYVTQYSSKKIGILANEKILLNQLHDLISVKIIIEGSSTLSFQVTYLLNQSITNEIVEHVTGIQAADCSQDIKESLMCEFSNWITTSFGSKLVDYGHKLGNFRIEFNNSFQDLDLLVKNTSTNQIYLVKNDSRNIIGGVFYQDI